MYLAPEASESEKSLIQRGALKPTVADLGGGKSDCITKGRKDKRLLQLWQPRSWIGKT